MRRYVIAVVVMLVVAGGWTVLLPSAPASQPIAFPHAKHQNVGCAVCHRGVTTTAHASFPDVALCAKCHATPPGAAAAVWNAALDKTPIAWVQVTRVPSHVMFSHRRHVGIAKLECASCHGEMRDRQTPPVRAAVRLEMTTCLSCHRHEGAAEDCAACHR